MNARVSSSASDTTGGVASASSAAIASARVRIVGHHSDRGVRRLPPVSLEVRRVHAHDGGTRPTVASQLAVGESGAVEVDDPSLQQVLRSYPAVVLTEKRLHAFVFAPQLLTGV